MAGTIGTGNIVGVATAIGTGGPGAIFWMWISALVGMMTKYSEVVLSVRFRDKTSRGEWKGGPMYYIQNGLRQKWLAVIFAVFAFLASFGIGNMTQGNSIATSMNTTFGVPPLATGIVLVAVVGTVTELKVVWDISDTPLNGLMAIPNLIGLLGLSGVVFKLTKEYFAANEGIRVKIEP